MHDFICCENVENCFTLSSEEMAIAPQQLYFHPLYLLFHRDHLQLLEETSTLRGCEFSWKENYSLLDLFHPITSLMLSSDGSSVSSSRSAASQQKKAKKSTATANVDQEFWKLFLPVLAMDTCAIR